MKRICRNILFFLPLFSLSQLALAENTEITVEIDPSDLETSMVCSPDETRLYIINQTFHLSSPIHVPNEKELVDAYLEVVCEEEPDSKQCENKCFTMPDFEFSDQWEEFLEAYEKAGEILCLTAECNYGKMLDEARKKAWEAFTDELKKLACDLADFDKISKTLLEKANSVIKDKYDFDMENINDSSMELLEDSIRKNQGDEKADLFFNPEEFSDDQRDDAMDKIREKDDAFWKGI